MSRRPRLRPCLDCGVLTLGKTRCSACTARRSRGRDARRGTPEQRGYGAAHRALRRRLLATYLPTDPCARCGLPLGEDEGALHLGHSDDRLTYTGLEHKLCNLRAGGLASQRHAKQVKAR
jgi:hypothetical protein